MGSHLVVGGWWGQTSLRGDGDRCGECYLAGEGCLWLVALKSLVGEWTFFSVSPLRNTLTPVLERWLQRQTTVG